MNRSCVLLLFWSVGAGCILSACQDSQFLDSEAPVFGNKSSPPAETPQSQDGSSPSVSPSGPGSSAPTDAGLTPVTPPQPTDQIFFRCSEDPTKPIVADVFRLQQGTDRLPNFANEQVLQELCMGQFDVVDRDFTEGFPGVPELVEWFGLALRVKFVAPVDGTYTFILRSDDGSRLRINGSEIINLDGLHPVKEKQASLDLKAGTHDLAIDYFQGPKFRIALELQWLRPGAASAEYIPRERLIRP